MDPGRVEELADGIKQLIIGTRPYIQHVSSMDEARQTYIHLEEHDRNFHRYSLVKTLRAEIEEAVGGQLDEQLRYHSDDPTELMEGGAGQESLVNIIASHIMQSTEYLEMVDRTERGVQQACNQLLVNYDSHFPSSHSRGLLSHTPGGEGFYNIDTNSEVLFSDAESSIGDSSSCYSVPLYLTTERQEDIANQLSTHSNTQAKHKALQDLFQLLVLFETQNINNKAWSDIRQGLTQALLHADEQLAMSAVRVIARGFTLNNSVSREISHDLYVTLVEVLKVIFTDKVKVSVPRVRQGVDCSQPYIQRLLKMFRLLNDFQLDVTQYWQRYSDRVVEELQDVTLTLLTLSSDDHLTPLHCLALVDPSARWFIRFMHANNSRSVLLHLLTKHKTFVCTAVEACYEYNALLDQQSKTTAGNKATGVTRQYSQAHIHSLLFLHSLSVVSRLLMYSRGRALLPVNISISAHCKSTANSVSEDEVTVTDLLIILISILSKQQQHTSLERDVTDAQYNVGDMVAGVLKRVCGSEQVCCEIMCRDNVLLSLLQPLSRWVESSPTAEDTPRACDWSLVHITDVLSAYVSSSCGQRYLMCGGNKSSSSEAMVHRLYSYARHALIQGLVPRAVTAGLVYVCRQLYSTCEGLITSLPYQLHTALYTAWDRARKERESLIGGAQADAASITAITPVIIMDWEETLCDNLLNYTATPRGLLYVVSTGTLLQCVQHMLHRCDRKLQVSKCEKFGYGYMMSQIAGTVPGIKALSLAGFVRAHIRALWASIEVVDDEVSFTPRPWSVSCLDKSTAKPFSDIINLLTTREAVQELLYNSNPSTVAAQHSHRSVPETLQELMDRIVLVDNNDKIHSLFNYEQSHCTGLMLLNVLISCLDSMLLLQSRYNYQQLLLQAQSSNTVESSGQIIVDMLAVWRNHILIRSYLVGGPTERLLPSTTLSDSTLQPLFSTYPPPAYYTLTANPVSAVSIRGAHKEESELSRFLSSTSRSDITSEAWMNKCKTYLSSLLATRPQLLHPTLVIDLLEKAVDSYSRTSRHALFSTQQLSLSDSALKSLELTSAQLLGVELTLRYAQRVGVAVSNKEARYRLPLLVKRVSAYLIQQQVHPTNLLHDSTRVFDWFMATMYLLMGAQSEKTWKFLLRFSTLLSSAYLWSQRLHRSVHLPQLYLSTEIPPISSIISHHIELILYAELPQVYSAFKMSGFSPAQICVQWLRQCFWNYLDWKEISDYSVLCIVLGVDYQIYTCVALLKHLQPLIMSHTLDKSLLAFIKTEPVHGFRFPDYMDYMKHLQTKYSPTIVTDLYSICDQR